MNFENLVHPSVQHWILRMYVKSMTSISQLYGETQVTTGLYSIPLLGWPSCAIIF